MGHKIQFALKDDSDSLLQLDSDKLPDCNDLLKIFKIIDVQFDNWFSLAIEYYKKNKYKEFEFILEDCFKLLDNLCEQDKESDNYKKNKLKALNTYAAYYVRIGNKERKSDKRREYFEKAKKYYGISSEIGLYDAYYLLGRAYLSLLKGEEIHQLDSQLNLSLMLCPNSDYIYIPSLLVRACVEFNKKDYKSALSFFKKVFYLKPNICASVRLGIGHCYFKQGEIAKAKLSFQQELKYNEKSVGALVGLAVLELNQKTKESIRNGVEMLSKAYYIDKRDPIVLVYLADHHFYKNDYDIVEELALQAYYNTENKAIRAQSCYQFARSCHVKGDLDEAFVCYYQATQMASPEFVLPQYGLGQMYIHRSQLDKACECFEKVLAVHKDNYETMKILGSIYAQSNDQLKRQQAKQYLKKVTEQRPDDVEAWIQLAQILEQTDLKGALSAYTTAMLLLKDEVQLNVPAEILNNVAALYFRLGNFNEALHYYTQSIERCKLDTPNDQRHYESINVTINYNLARLYEALCYFEKAKKIYKDISFKHEDYIDCYLRLGCMARDIGDNNNAQFYFNQALYLDKDQPDALLLLGNYYLANGQTDKAKTSITTNEDTSLDAYAHIALGNIYLQRLHNTNKDKEKEKIDQDSALFEFKKVLRKDERNIWAVNGIGAVLAHKRYIHEARQVFQQVQESTVNFSDLWLNIAHIYVEQKQYVCAIQMYKNCLEKFYKQPNVDILLYLARAYYKFNKLKECKDVLLKARMVAPEDTVILYNLAVVLKVIAKSILENGKSNLKTVVSALHELNVANKYFQFLFEHGDRTLVDTNQAQVESIKCQHLLSKTKSYISIANTVDEAEQDKKKKLEEERLLILKKQDEEKRKKEEEEFSKNIQKNQIRKDWLDKNKRRAEPFSHITQPAFKKRKFATKFKSKQIIYSSSSSSSCSGSFDENKDLSNLNNHQQAFVDNFKSHQITSPSNISRSNSIIDEYEINDQQQIINHPLSQIEDEITNFINDTIQQQQLNSQTINNKIEPIGEQMLAISNEYNLVQQFSEISFEDQIDNEENMDIVDLNIQQPNIEIRFNQEEIKNFIKDNFEYLLNSIVEKKRIYRLIEQNFNLNNLNQNEKENLTQCLKLLGKKSNKNLQEIKHYKKSIEQLDTKRLTVHYYQNIKLKNDSEPLVIKNKKLYNKKH